MKAWSRIATWSLVGFMAINIAGTACFFVLQAKMRQAKPRPALAEGAKFPNFSGIDVRGASWQPRAAAPCRVIRIAEDHCAYCRKDQPSYEKLVDAARHAACEVIEVAPAAGGMADNPRPGIVQLKFVDGDIGSVLFPFVTPQTIILDRDWTVRMTRRGIFDDQSLASSMALVGSLSAPLAAR